MPSFQLEYGGHDSQRDSRRLRPMRSDKVGKRDHQIRSQFFPRLGSHAPMCGLRATTLSVKFRMESLKISHAAIRLVTNPRTDGSAFIRHYGPHMRMDMVDDLRPALSDNEITHRGAITWGRACC